MIIVYALMVWAACLTLGSALVFAVLLAGGREQLKINELNHESIDWLNKSYLDLATAHDILIKEHAALVREVRAMAPPPRPRTYDTTSVPTYWRAPDWPTP